MAEVSGQPRSRGYELSVDAFNSCFRSGTVQPDKDGRSNDRWSESTRFSVSWRVTCTLCVHREIKEKSIPDKRRFKGTKEITL